MKIVYTKDMDKNKKKIHQLITYGLLVAVLVLSGGCGTNGDDGDGITYFHHSIADKEKEEGTQAAEPEEGADYYLVTNVNQIEETLLLYRYENNMEYRYYYGQDTRLYNKYGNRATITDFTPGQLVTLGEVNEEGILTKMQISDTAWVYDKVKRFSVNSNLNVLKIADTKYRYDENTFVFSGENRLQMTDIGEGDILSVTGVDKQILAVNVTTSEGTLQLQNTELFEGSFVQVGMRMFSLITPNLSMQVPEGTYTIMVANNGWGGSQEITITRGETTVVDLNKLKGKGPKKGRIQFVVDVADAVLMIDGGQVDYSKPVKLTYGNHDLEVYATGYDVWRRSLYVNSKESTIAIALADEPSGSGGSGNSTGSSESQSSQNSQNSQGSSQSESSSISESERRQRELDTIKSLISGMTSGSTFTIN